jgi:type IV pilus assembly protein PilO
LDLKLNFSKLNIRRCLIMSIIVAIAVLTIFYRFYYDPSKKKLIKIRRDTKKIIDALEIAKIQAGSVEKLEKDIKDIEKQLVILRAKIATSGEVIPIIKTIEKEAKDLGVKVINIVTNVQEPPPPPNPKNGAKDQKQRPLQGWEPGYTRISFDIKLQGEYKKMEDFIKAIQNLAAFLVIDDISIISDKGLYPELTTKLVINVYKRRNQ